MLALSRTGQEMVAEGASVGRHGTVERKFQIRGKLRLSGRYHAAWEILPKNGRQTHDSLVVDKLSVREGSAYLRRW